MTFKESACTMVPPVILSALSLLLLCIAYLPIKSNALITVDLKNANFSSIYPSKAVIGKTTEYIPGWINDTAWATFNSSDLESRKKYHYMRYGYKENKTANILGPELPELKLHDTNFCDEYSIGLWGYWAHAKTNGVSNSALQRDMASPLEDKIYLKPYALKNHTEFKATANIWDIVKRRSPLTWYTVEEDVLDNLRIAIILLSISLFVNMGMYSLARRSAGNEAKNGFRIIHVFSAGAILSLSFKCISLTVSVVAAVISIQELEGGLATNEPIFREMGATWRANHQVIGLGYAAIGLTALDILATIYCGASCFIKMDN